LVKELEILFLFSKLEFFCCCIGEAKAHTEEFHQNISAMEKWYQDRGNSSMLADYGGINDN
jgi:hypothetical protein